MKKNRHVVVLGTDYFVNKIVNFAIGDIWEITPHNARTILELAFSSLMDFYEGKGSVTLENCITKHCELKSKKPIERLGYEDDIQWKIFNMLYELVTISASYMAEQLEKLEIADYEQQRLVIRCWIGNDLAVEYDDT